MALLFVFWGDRLEKAFSAKSAEYAKKKVRKEKVRKEKRLVILRKPVAGLSDASLAKFVARASRATKLIGAVNVLVTSSVELRSLNRRFRAKDQPTDVLSFPAAPEVASGLAGDIAISADIARQNGKKLGHTAAQEIKILVLHGVLHLSGYDHERDNGKMAARETALRRSLGLPHGLIERQAQPARAKRNAKASEKKSSRARSRGQGARVRPAGRTT